jgi:hypothetical protein
MDNVHFRTRQEAEIAAPQRAGVTPGARPDEVWTVGDDVTQRGTPGYRYSANRGSHGTYEQFETEAGSRVVVNHTNDPNASSSHFHAGQPKGDSSRDGVDFGWGGNSERYAPVGEKHHFYYPEGPN